MRKYDEGGELSRDTKKMRGPKRQVRDRFFLESHDLNVSGFSPLLTSTMASNSIKLLTGNSHPELAQLVADRYVMHHTAPLRAARTNNRHADSASS